MANADIQVRVLLRPDDGAGRRPWPCPPGVTLELKRQGSGAVAAQVQQAITQADGMTAPVQLAEGAYQVSMTDFPGHTWWEPNELRVRRRSAPPRAAGQADEESDAAQVLEVELVPKDGYRLLVARLVTEDGEHVPGAAVTITAAGEPAFDETFGPCSDHTIYAVAPKGMVTLAFESTEVNGKPYCPQAFAVPYPVAALAEVNALEFIYWPQVTICATPTVTTGTDTVPQPLIGTNVTVEYQRPAPAEGKLVLTKTLAQNDPNGMVSFDFAFPGSYTATVKAPDTWGSLPIANGFVEQSQTLEPGGCWEIHAAFSVVATEPVAIAVQLPPNQQLVGDASFSIDYGTGSVAVVVDSRSGQGSTSVPAGGTLTLSLTSTPTTAAGNLPLQMSDPDQVLTPGGTNLVVLEYEHSITVHAVDEQGHSVQGAVIQVFDQYQTPAGSGVTGPQGTSVIGVPSEGAYYLAEGSVAGETMRLTPVMVQSSPQVEFRVQSHGGGSGTGGEALTDLSAYPVLTEEISTTGVPAPVAGGTGGGGSGAGYGQTVDQVMRDVLGWRPSGDVAGFQAALSGAFQLREVEGHTAWTWQQRGYAVQADMGALRGAQASIYARAKNALDQMLPLLAGLSTLNPALYQPQDLEAIRTVVKAELNELVTELALPGGPRIQRVDQLFVLLLGEGQRLVSLDPDLVGGNLGTLRDRFGLTEDNVDTVDEEQIVTNFRVIVEQVLALEASWHQDRQLLSGVNARTALGTVLIWLSRALEAVCESVDDLAFALDSVYVDAAQRQVIELRFASQAVHVPDLPLTRNTTSRYSFPRHEAPLLLSDLLDWITRASRDEGPRIIQDAGKDGVLNFEPQLNKLRILVHATRQVARHGTTLPSGMQTPRVNRVFQVLAAQLDEATNLAGLVRREPIPQIAGITGVTRGTTPGTIAISISGSNLHRSDAAVLIADNREDLPELRSAAVVSHGAPITPGMAITSRADTATATFVDPSKLRDAAGTTWLVALIDENGTLSNQVEAVRVPYASA